MNNLDISAALAAALGRAVRDLNSLARNAWAAAAVRLNLTGSGNRIVGASVIPTVRYRDVPAAVAWLTRAFGMQVHRVVAGTDGAPRYAELTVGSGMLMVAPIEDTAFGRLMVQPDEIGGVETQVCYLRVGNARAHYARAKSAGAVIVIDPEDAVNNGRGYSCRDPEGHVWNFGTYDPWDPQPRPATRAPWRPRRLQQGLAALLLLAGAGAAIAKLIPQESARAGTTATVVVATVPSAGGPKAADLGQSATDATVQATPQDAGKADPKSTPVKIAAALEPPPDAGPTNDLPVQPTEDAPARADDGGQRIALAAAEQTAAKARAELAEVRGALAKAQRDAGAVRAQLEELQRAKQAAERTAAEARARIATAQRAAEIARSQAGAERARRLAAIRAVFRARRARATHAARVRIWCYNPAVPYAPVPPGRLAGFCRL